MEMRQVRYFVEVAKVLNFNEAARQLHIAQPALSQQIHNLENELGVLLFNREKRQIKLTAAGQVLYQDFIRVLVNIELATQTCKRVARGEEGRLKIGFTPIACWLLPEIIGNFQEKYPNVDLIINELLDSNPMQAVKNEQIDLAVVFEEVNDEKISGTLINRSSCLLAVAESNELADLTGKGSRGKNVEWKDLPGQSIILFPRQRQPRLFDTIIQSCQAAGFTPEIIKEAIQLETIMNMVSARRGIAILPDYLREIISWKGVVFLELEKPTPQFDFFAVWRKGDVITPTLANFLKLINPVDTEN